MPSGHEDGVFRAAIQNEIRTAMAECGCQAQRLRNVASAWSQTTGKQLRLSRSVCSCPFTTGRSARISWTLALQTSRLEAPPKPSVIYGVPSMERKSSNSRLQDCVPAIEVHFETASGMSIGSRIPRITPLRDAHDASIHHVSYPADVS
eukprot:8289118-Pyramimonas_sp.AAC.1